MDGERWAVYMPPALDEKLMERVGDRTKSATLRGVVREHFEQRNRRIAGFLAGLVALFMTAVYALAPPSYAVAAGAAGCLLIMVWGAQPVVQDIRKTSSGGSTAAGPSESTD